MAPKNPGKKRVARNMRALLAQHEQAKRAGRDTSPRGNTKGRVHCPICGHGNTHKIKRQGGGFLRECNSCNERFGYPR